MARERRLWVVPAKAGTQAVARPATWIPACAGMTTREQGLGAVRVGSVTPNLAVA